MIEYQNSRAASVIGPFGEVLTMDTIPPAKATRWVARRKAEVVAAVDGGLLTIDEALERYELSMEEFVSWRRAMGREGIPGLCVSSAQHYRDAWKQGQAQGHLRILRPQSARSVRTHEMEPAREDSLIG